MPGFNPERININDLTIEEPEVTEKLEVSFDPNKFFTEWDWRALKRLATERDGDLDDLLYPNAAIAIIDKEKLPEMSDSVKDRIKVQVKESTEKGYLQALAWANYLSPEFVQVPADVLEKAVKINNEKLNECRDKNDWRHFFEHAAWLTVIGRRPKLSQEDFIKLEAELKSQMDVPEYLIEDGSAMSIIYPEYPLKISEETGKKMTMFLEAQMHNRALGEWELFAAMAKIVADKCVEVASRKDPETETPDLPEVKKF